MNDQRTRSRRRLVFLALLFIGPLALAWVLYSGSGGWRPAGSTAHGELISPPVPLHEVSADYLLGEAPDGLFRHSWSLGVISADGCSGHCAEVLIKIRQIRLTLGKDMDRISRVLMIAGPAADIDALANLHPGLIVVDAGGGVMADVVADFPGAAQTGDWIYLVDPLGNLMMRYAWDAGSHGIREDLKRLLRLSRIG